MLNRAGLFIVVGVAIVLAIGAFIFIRQREPVRIIELVSFDASPLYKELSGCNMVRIKKPGGDVLYESRDAEEVGRVIDSIIVNTNSIQSTDHSLPFYLINFYRDAELVVQLGAKDRSRLYWYQPSWDWTTDFWLTSESYRKLVLWFCEKTGKTEKDLFNPYPEDANWNIDDNIMQKNKYKGAKRIKVKESEDR